MDKNLFPISKYKLCYIEENKAYFTTQKLSDVYGDGWHKVPYEHNSSPPHEWNPITDKEKKEWSIASLYFDVFPAITPCYCHTNSPYSVNMINKKVIGWLTIDSVDHTASCFAGIKYLDFVDFIVEHGGKVFVDAHQRFYNR